MLCGTWLSLLNFMKWDNNIIKKDIDNMYMCSANLLLRVTTTQNSDFSVYKYCPPLQSTNICSSLYHAAFISYSKRRKVLRENKVFV